MGLKTLLHILMSGVSRRRQVYRCAFSLIDLLGCALAPPTRSQTHRSLRQERQRPLPCNIMVTARRTVLADTVQSESESPNHARSETRAQQPLHDRKVLSPGTVSRKDQPHARFHVGSSAPVRVTQFVPPRSGICHRSRARPPFTDCLASIYVRDDRSLQLGSLSPARLSSNTPQMLCW
jgi:hypothetical protein